jgi:hypothetical protein
LVTIVIIVAPSRRGDGQSAYSARGQLLDGTVDRRPADSDRTTQPMLDASPFLLADGVDPAIQLVTRQ